MGGSLANLSVQKFSSNVIEKCLVKADDRVRVALIDELSAEETLTKLLQDPYGNYVIQTALDKELSWKSASNPSFLFFATRAMERKSKASSPHARIDSDCHQPSRQFYRTSLLVSYCICISPLMKEVFLHSIMGTGEESIVVVLKVIIGSVLNKPHQEAILIET